MNNKIINVKDYKVSNDNPFFLMAGPCQMESRDHALFMVEKLKNITDKLNINLIYKSSFDKANRTSASGARGIGIDAALRVFEEIKSSFNLPVITDVHNESQCKIVSEVVDVLQIPAFLCRQTDLLKAAAETKKPLNIKKGQFLAPWDMKNVAKKIEAFGGNDILLCDRGTSFGYNKLITDIRGFPIMAETGYPVVLDATHSVQEPSSQGGSSGGERRFVEVLARAAIAVGISGLFMEVHQDPDNAPSDGPCMVKLDDLEGILTRLKAIDDLVKAF